MNWAKAKTILIIIFTLLNIILYTANINSLEYYTNYTIYYVNAYTGSVEKMVKNTICCSMYFYEKDL